MIKLALFLFLQKCVENSQFDISDVISDTRSYFYTTRDLGQQLESTDEILTTEPVPVKPVYTLARDFVADLETLLHKITQTFVRIGQTEEGRKTLNHIYIEAFTIASNEISVGTLKYIMKESVKVLQDPNASKVVLEFVEMIQELMEYDLVDWYFVVPFLYDINRHPVPEQILEKFKTEVEYILLSEERKNSFAAAFKLFEDGLNSAANESLKTIPITTSTLEPPKNAVPVRIAVSETAATTAGSAKSETSAFAEQVTQIPGKRVSQIPVKQVEQVTKSQ